MFEDNFNCSKCLSQYKARPDREKHLDLLKRRKGCQSPGSVKPIVENIKFNICIGNFYSQVAAQYIDLYYNYQRGVMPYDGTLMDQPSKVIDVFNIIDALIKAKQIEFQKKQQQEYASKSKVRSNGRSKI